MPSETRMQTAYRVSDGICPIRALSREWRQAFLLELAPSPAHTEASNKAFHSDGSDCLV
ncbi:hypothetical protein [Neisseria meningitidis]|uniref:hypothetical protein n=1 Tax=Neisseria meningitidis TaxID=487 RepID=UPI0013DF7B97|nr:hypothetical protein [Neisseria meningitidis]